MPCVLFVVTDWWDIQCRGGKLVIGCNLEIHVVRKFKTSHHRHLPSNFGLAMTLSFLRSCKRSEVAHRMIIWLRNTLFANQFYFILSYMRFLIHVSLSQTKVLECYVIVNSKSHCQYRNFTANSFTTVVPTTWH